jgi:phage replication O-like protein O
MTGDEVQVDKGNFTRVHNAIFEKLAKTRLNGQEFRAIMFLFRRTYGWNKKEDAISLSQWQEGLDLTHRQHVYPILESLLQKKIIYRNKKVGLIWVYGFNKYFEEWETGVTLEGDKESVTPQGYRGVTLEGDKVVPNRVTEVVPNRVTTKDNIKDNIQKKGLKTDAGTEPNIPDCLATDKFRNTWLEWLAYRKETKHPLKPITQKKQLESLEKHTPEIACAMLDQSMTNGWQGIFEVKKNGNGSKSSQYDQTSQYLRDAMEKARSSNGTE